MGESRKLPFYFGPNESITTTIIIKVPEGASVESLPVSEKFLLNEGEMEFIYLVQEGIGVIQLQINLENHRGHYAESDFSAIRDFYSVVSKKLNEPIVLSEG